jgi:N-carbamoylputrescine amidase
MNFGGTGWIIDPENGTLLATTTGSEPFVTMDIDPGWAEAAKATYPRYVPD